MPPVSPQNLTKFVYLSADRDPDLEDKTEWRICNLSAWGGTYDGRMSMPMMIVMLVLGFITFFVNLGVIIRTIKILRHGHDNKPAFYFIGNLALSDLAMGLYIVIAFLLHMTNQSDLWQQKSCSLQIGVAVTACQETIFTITLISVDKYLYICHALKYHQIVTMTRVYIAVITSWVISFIIGSLPAMGMLVKWEDTCGRCIFAQVVSKEFAILFFVTAVVIPYAISVTLYSILLFLALKMQKARYGGSYKVNETGRTSYFRLSFMSTTKTSKSRISITSGTKSISSKSSLSTTVSSVSGSSPISKTHRRRMRKQAMQDYKASLPGLDNKQDGNFAAKVIHVKSTNLNEDLKIQRQNAVEENYVREIGVNVIKDHDDETSYLNNIEDRENVIHEIDVKQCSIVAVNEDNNTENLTTKHNEDQESGDVMVHIEKETNNLDESNKENEDIRKNADEPRITETESISKNDIPVPEMAATGEEPIPVQEQLTRSVSKELQKKLSETSISTKSLPSLTSTTDEDEANDDSFPQRRWSLLSRYFNGIVTDTKDKVLFLKKCQAVKTVFLIIGSFTVTYVPFVVGSLVYSLTKEKSKGLLHALQSILFCAIVANSLINPLLYAYGYNEFRVRTKKFKGVFATKKKPEM